MAQKTKKKLTSKERKAQRRAELERRHGHGWQPPTTPDEESVAESMALLQQLTSSPKGEEQFTMLMVDSGDLADEPEMTEIFLNPIQAAEVFAEVAMKLNPDPDATESLSEEEQDEIQFRIQEETSKRLLTKSVRQEILDGLNKMRLRLKQSGDRDALARVALLHKVLSSDRRGDSWATIGMVQAILRRSVGVGMELIQSAMELGPEFEDDPASFNDLMNQPERIRQTEALVDSVPGLRQYLRRQTDELWEKAQQAVGEGDWFLELYTDDETRGLIGVFRETVGLPAKIDDAEDNDSSLDLSERLKGIEPGIMVSNIEAYITELFTPERIAQLRTRLTEIMTDKRYTAEQWQFARILETDFEEDDVVQEHMPFLLRALFGELRVRSRAVEEGEDNQDDE